MRDFAAIDFETANNERSSVCSVGLDSERDTIVINLSTLLYPFLIL